MANFYMKDIAAFRDATILLSFEEKGYFDELLSLVYLYDGCLPDNDDLICRAMPVNKKVHLRLKNKLIKQGLISIKDGFYHNSRATQEILKINSKSTKNKTNASKRWAKSLKNNDTADANADADAMPIVKDECKDTTKVVSKTRPKKIARRIENEFKTDRSLPDKYREFAVSEGLADPERTWEQFFDYWKGASGKNASKLDWLATWRRWVRENVDRANANSPNFKKPTGNSGSTTIDGARLAIDRRRKRDADLRQSAPI